MTTDATFAPTLRGGGAANHAAAEPEATHLAGGLFRTARCRPQRAHGDATRLSLSRPALARRLRWRSCRARRRPRSPPPVSPDRWRWRPSRTRRWPWPLWLTGRRPRWPQRRPNRLLRRQERAAPSASATASMASNAFCAASSEWSCVAWMTSAPSATACARRLPFRLPVRPQRRRAGVRSRRRPEQGWPPRPRPPRRRLRRGPAARAARQPTPPSAWPRDRCDHISAPGR